MGEKKRRYNDDCQNYCRNSEGSYCYIEADMTFCTKNCAWATNGIGDPFPTYRGKTLTTNKYIARGK